MTTAPPETAASPGELRDAMVNTLLTDGHITSGAVERAFRKVPARTSTPPGPTSRPSMTPTR